ncbi:MAG: hypothetical protein ACI89E_000608 [Planctomycetota bacterium]|jgi:hypothetical protein
MRAMKNNNASLFLMLIVGVFVGGGLGFLLFGTGQVQAESNSGLSNSRLSNGGMQVPQQSSANKPKAISLVAGTPEVKREKPKKAQASLVSEADTKKLLANVQVQEASAMKGDGAINGHVADDDGNALAGVVIRLTGSSRSFSSTSPSTVGQGAPERVSLKETVRKAAQGYQDRKGLRFETKTDGAGDYRFEDLEDNTWSLTAFLEGFQVEPESSANRVRIGGEVDFTAKSVIQIPVEILMPDGSQPEQASISVKRLGKDAGGKRYAWSSEEPFLRVVPGRYEVRAYSHNSRGTDFSEYASETVKVAIKAGAVPESIDLSFLPRIGISGYVRMPKGDTGRRNYIVRLMPLTLEQEVDLNILGDSEVREWARPGSLFTFSDLEAGRYAVGASRDWSSPIVVHQIVELTVESAEIQLEVPELDHSQALRVTVLDATGSPLDDVGFQLKQESGNGSRSSGVQTVREGEAGYLLTFPGELHKGYFGQEETSAKYSVRVTHAEFGTRTTPLTRGQTELTVTFEVPGQLTVTVPGYSGSGCEGRLRVIAIRKEEVDGRHYGSTNTKDKVDVDGVRNIEGLEPGLYVVSLMVDPVKTSRHSWSSGREVNKIEFDVRAGANSLRLTIPALYPLRVHWADAKEGATLHLSSQATSENNFGFGNKEFDSNGFAEWGDLPPGNYTLHSYSGTSEMMEITVPSGQIEFTPMVINAMRVSITDAEGDLAKVGFREGDMIIGANGKEYQSQADFMAVAQQLQVKSFEVEFILMRAGKRITLHVSGADMNGWQSMGGQMKPTSR